MAKQEIDVRGTSDASPSEVWALLGDSAGWAEWTPIDEVVSVENGGEVGEIRIFRTGRIKVTERIEEREPGRRLVYSLLSGLPVRDYRAEIDLTADGAGTAVRWHTTFEAKIPGTGGALRRGLDKATREFVAGLTAHAG